MTQQGYKSKLGNQIFRSTWWFWFQHLLVTWAVTEPQTNREINKLKLYWIRFCGRCLFLELSGLHQLICLPEKTKNMFTPSEMTTQKHLVVNWWSFWYTQTPFNSLSNMWTFSFGIICMSWEGTLLIVPMEVSHWTERKLLHISCCKKPGTSFQRMLSGLLQLT